MVSAHAFGGRGVSARATDSTAGWAGAATRDGGPCHEESSQAIEVDCDRCVLADSEACDDCVVSFVVGRPERRAVVVNAQEARAVRLLSSAGLVPALRHLPKTG